jgi:polyphosphate kinase 2
MAEFDLEDLDKISKSREIIDLLVSKGIIKEKKFLEQLKYEKELEELQNEMLRLQEFLIQQGKRMLIIYEGRDAAGKGGTISRTIAKMNPKNYRVVALPKPTELEQKEWYFQRYLKNLPRKEEIVFFDRSWYNRAVVEPVFGFCTPEQHEAFLEQVNPLENLLIQDGIILIKFFLNISKEEQKERLDERKEDEMKQYKIGGLDQQAQEKWEDYSFYFDKMLKRTSSEKSPWIEIKTDDKKIARLETMKYILQSVDGFESKLELKNNAEILKIWK